MAKITLLEVVQDILSDADSDDVNSIADTVEADQCARVVRDVYHQIVDLHDLEHIKTLKQLEATSASTPNVMTRPEGFHSVEFIKYNNSPTAGGDQKFQEIHYREVQDFLESVHKNTASDATVTEVTLSTGLVLPIRNDSNPTYYTVMDVGSDEIVFDSWDNNLDANLQASKSLIYGMQRPSLTLSDTSTFDLPRHLETLIKREARAMFFDLYKDGLTPEIDRSRRRAEVRAQRQRNIVKNSDNDNRPDYGRRR
jgi:hypothetical protein